VIVSARPRPLSPRERFRALFGPGCRPVLGMVHLPPLPGSPGFDGHLDAVVEHALGDARTLVDAGCDALIVENFHDAPFFRETTAPELVAAMTVAAHEVRRAVSVPIGINVLRNSWQAAMAIASVIGGAFVRVNVLTDAMVTDQGLIQGCAAELSRYRAALGSEVLIFADILSKHAAPLAERPVEVLARDAAHRGGADALIVSGDESSDPPDPQLVERVRAAVPEMPLILGSGMTAAHADLLRAADGAVFGYGAKPSGDMTRPVSAELTRQFVSAVARLSGGD
jgi:membrane complex biogenesis BtpA family protein